MTKSIRKKEPVTMEIRRMTSNVKTFVRRGPNGTTRLVVYLGAAVALVTLLLKVSNMTTDLHGVINREIDAAQTTCRAKNEWNDMEIRVRSCEEQGVAIEATVSLTLTEVRAQRVVLDAILLKLGS